MAIETAFADMMPSTVTVNAVSTTDSYGVRTFSATGTSIQCRIQKSRKLIISADGKEIVEEGRIYAYGVATVTVDDKLTLPDATIVPILAVETRNDDNGTYVTVISFGAA